MNPAEGRLEWAAYNKALHNKEVYLLYFQRRLFSVVPKRAFRSAEEEAAFRDLLKRKVSPDFQ